VNDCPLCENGIIVTVEYSLIGNPPERSGVPCWRCLTARAEKAERERDALQAMVLRSKVNHPFKSERTRRCDDCGEYESAHIQPMTAVTEDGRMWRLTPHGSWLTKRNPDGSLHCNHSDRDHCRVQGHETEITYRLVPIEEVDR